MGPETSANGALQTIAASSFQLAGTAVQSLIDSLTLIRTRGELLLFIYAATATGDGFHGAFGIAKASIAAIVAGVASVPTPIDEEAWDGWLYHRYFNLFSGGTIAAADAAKNQNQINSTTAAQRIEIDSKAMRKLSVDEGLFGVIQVIEVGTASMRWAFNCRQLVKDMG